MNAHKLNIRGENPDEVFEEKQINTQFSPSHYLVLTYAFKEGSSDAGFFLPTMVCYHSFSPECLFIYDVLLDTYMTRANSLMTGLSGDFFPYLVCMVTE